MENLFQFETGAGDGNTADTATLEGIETWASNRKIRLRQIKGLSQDCGTSVVYNPNTQKAESGGSLSLRPV